MNKQEVTIYVFRNSNKSLIQKQSMIRTTKKCKPLILLKGLTINKTSVLNKLIMRLAWIS